MNKEKYNDIHRNKMCKYESGAAAQAKIQIRPEPNFLPVRGSVDGSAVVLKRRNGGRWCKGHLTSPLFRQRKSSATAGSSN